MGTAMITVIPTVIRMGMVILTGTITPTISQPP